MHTSAMLIAKHLWKDDCSQAALLNSLVVTNLSNIGKVKTDARASALVVGRGGQCGGFELHLLLGFRD